jgi:hypothetical protein
MGSSVLTLKWKVLGWIATLSMGCASLAMLTAQLH